MRVTVMDGGMGRELLRIGAPFRQPEWSALALIEGPEWVVRAHSNFIAAGADVITTNSYAVVPFHVGHARFAAQGRQLAEIAGQLARRAALEAPRPVVAASLPPLFGSYQPQLFEAAAAAAIIDPLVDGLAPYVDVWLAETLSCIDEARAAREALDRAKRDEPLWISFTLDDRRPATLRSGENVLDAMHAATDLGVEVISFNCSRAETITDALRVVDSDVPDGMRIGAYANRFADSHAPEAANEGLSGLRTDLDPDTYRGVVEQWLHLGVTVVGGCCGIQPEHIRAIADLVATRG